LFLFCGASWKALTELFSRKIDFIDLGSNYDEKEISMSIVEIDERAKEKAIKDYGFPPCIHIPIAAMDEDAIKRFIGEIVEVLVPGMPNKALVVQPYKMPELDMRMPIWQLKEAAVLHHSRQVWVHVNHPGYRKAYIKAFPNENLLGLVLDHVLNRRVARLKGFNYLRIVPISRGANSSSGGLSEKWGVEYHGTPSMVKKNKENPAFIQYADLADITKMLNLKTGGSIQDGVNDVINLVFI